MQLHLSSCYKQPLTVIDVILISALALLCKKFNSVSSRDVKNVHNRGHTS